MIRPTNAKKRANTVLNNKKSLPHIKGPPTPDTGCLPFFHPTRVVFVDDDPNFLKYFPPGLNANFPISCYASPGALLTDIARGRLETQLQVECWSSYTGRFADPQFEQMLSLDKTMLLMRVFGRHRFNPVSVMVVDYDMPEMDGLELCRRLAHLPCRKILLTGQASEAHAVAAFNEDLIDFFLPKGARNCVSLLRERIARYQRAFIADASRLVRQALRAEILMDWEDPGFCDLFAHLCEDLDIIEYYVIADPLDGFMLVDEHGRGRLLLTFSAAALAAQATMARIAGAPPTVVERLERRQAATFFAQEQGEAVLDAAAWCLACVPVQPFPTRPDRYYALLEAPAPFDVSPNTVLGLRAYLQGQA